MDLNNLIFSGAVSKFSAQIFWTISLAYIRHLPVTCPADKGVYR
jgi:hypothetical protein